MGVSEQVFWKAVRNDKLGYRVRRQVPIGPYILDFYTPKTKLCIEIDGEQHSLRVEKDRIKDDYLAEFGILTIRIPSLDLFEDRTDLVEMWTERIIKICEEREV